MKQQLMQVAAVLTVLVSCGCRTDAVLSRAKVSGAPVTAFESVEVARESKMTLANAQEVDLVEQLIYFRTMYRQTLSELHGYYDRHGYAEKSLWVEGELADVARIRPYHYLLDSEVPRLNLEPKDTIAEADALYERALKTASSAGHGTPGLYNREKMTQALSEFKQLIREFPTSDKIDDAAFYCGELHKEYFENEESIAVRWYELAWTWDPATPHSPRFQAAVVYDYRLHDRERALELYRAAIAAESSRSNRRWAVERIRQITEVRPSESERVLPVFGSEQAVGQDEPLEATTENSP